MLEANLLGKYFERDKQTLWCKALRLQSEVATINILLRFIFSPSFLVERNRQILPRADYSVPLMRHDPSDLGSLIQIRIIPKERTLNYILKCKLKMSIDMPRNRPKEFNESKRWDCEVLRSRLEEVLLQYSKILEQLRCLSQNTGSLASEADRYLKYSKRCKV